MKRLFLTLLLALLLPVWATAQEVRVDTFSVEIYGQYVLVSIDHVPMPDGVIGVGDTVTFFMNGQDEAGASLRVTGQFVSLDTTALRFIEQAGDTARAVALRKATVSVTATNIIYGTVVSLAVAWLDSPLNTWVWSRDREPTVLRGQSVVHCAAVRYDSGILGIGNGDVCVNAYNRYLALRGVNPQYAKVLKTFVSGIG